jgi:hypothetical protein
VARGKALGKAAEDDGGFVDIKALEEAEIDLG